MKRRHRAAHRERAPESPLRGKSEQSLLEQSLEADIAGYRVVRVLGAGSSAEVYLAYDSVVGPVALKVYRDECDPATIDRELSALAGHTSAHLLALIDVARSADGRVVAVVQRLSGPLLATLLRERGASWEAGEIVTVIAPLVGAIDAAHEAGFALGSLSAREVMFDETGSPFVIGLGRAVDVRERVGELGKIARAAKRADYQGLGELLAQLCAHSAPGEELDQERFEEWFSERLAVHPFEPFAAELEQRILEIAVPVPVRTTAELVAPAAHLSRVPISGPAPAVSPASLVSAFAALAFLPPEFGAQLRSALARVAQGLAAVRARLPRRRALLSAAALGCALVAAALLWPSGAPAGGATETTARSSLARESQPTSAPAANAAAPQQDAVNEDPVVAFPALIEARVRCLERLDRDCLELVDYRGGALEAADISAIASAAQSGGTVTAVPAAVTDLVVTERVGDAAILAFVAAGPKGGYSEPASVLMIRTEAGWRMRELFEPSGSVQDGA